MLSTQNPFLALIQQKYMSIQEFQTTICSNIIQKANIKPKFVLPNCSYIWEKCSVTKENQLITYK